MKKKPNILAMRPDQLPSIQTYNANSLLSLTLISEMVLQAASPELANLPPMVMDLGDDFADETSTVQVSVVPAMTGDDLSDAMEDDAEDQTEGKRAVTLSMKLGKVLSFTDAEMSKGEAYIQQRFAHPVRAAIGVALMNKLLGKVVAEAAPDANEPNFTAGNNVVKTAAQYTWDVVREIDGTLSSKKQAGRPRWAVMDRTYDTTLAKDAKLVTKNAGNAQLLETGQIGRVAGFTPVPWDDFATVADVGNLKAVHFGKEAFAFASRQPFIPPNFTGEVVNQKDPVTGIWMQTRRWYYKGKTYMASFVRCGLRRGLPDALIRVLSA